VTATTNDPNSAEPPVNKADVNTSNKKAKPKKKVEDDPFMSEDEGDDRHSPHRTVADVQARSPDTESKSVPVPVKKPPRKKAKDGDIFEDDIEDGGILNAKAIKPASNAKPSSKGTQKRKMAKAEEDSDRPKKKVAT
jgi:hypothetical protein